MEIFELHYPGMAPIGVPDQQNAMILLKHLENEFADANISLLLFEESNTQPESPIREQRQARSREIAREMEVALPRDLDPRQRFKEIGKISEVADLQARREEWAAGRLPWSYEFRLRFIYAHAFIYALDAIGKILNLMTGMGLPSGITEARDSYNSALPDLKKVRDSAHHIEDRARSVHHHDRPLVVRPVDNGAIFAPEGGFLGLGNLNGNKLGYTAEDGNYLEVEISRGSVVAAQTAIQHVLDSLTWKGHEDTVPR